jgi:isopentenyl-diphosphate delta-isomerase
MPEVISSEDELLILVDSNDQALGYETKAVCHDGRGILHRAFSILIFNDRNELLLQQRSLQKRLWGGFWANSCCSHPRKGESMDQAVSRRLRQELGMECPLVFLYKFEYQAAVDDQGSENELCWVYAGRCNEEPTINPNEIAAWQWVNPTSLDDQIINQSHLFAPWFQLEWPEVRSQHWHTIESLS